MNGMQRFRAVGFLAILFAALFSLQCSSGGGNSPIDGGDTDQEAVADQEEGTPECLVPNDCGSKDNCVDGKCVTASKCVNYKTCKDTQICWKQPLFGPEQYDEPWNTGYCREFCSVDEDCPADYQCLNGMCYEYTPYTRGEPVHQDGDQKTSLRASFVEGDLAYPMTVTTAGFGLRKGPLAPYAHGMGASTGVRDRLNIKVLTLDNGAERVVFVRIPNCFPTDFFVSTVKAKVVEMGGPDLFDNMVVTATHSHSAPGSYWNMLPGMGFGALGFGEFSWELFDIMTTSIAETVYAGQQEDEFFDAAFGYAVIEDFDPEDEINHDRRPENPPFKDPRMFVFRVDDVSKTPAEPRVALFNYATHGTVDGGSDTYVTCDSGCAGEFMMERLFAEEFGDRVETVFLQGLAGDIAPSGGLGTGNAPRNQLLGTRVYEKVMSVFDDIETKSDIDLEIINKRVPINREYVGYADNEFYSDGESDGELTDFPGPFRFGAFQCGGEPDEGVLQAYMYDTDLVEEAVSNRSTDSDVTRELLTISAAASESTHKIKVAGVRGAMNNYKIQAYIVEETGKTARCIDPRCGGPCGSCTDDGVRKDGEEDPFSVIDCENDVLDNGEPDKAYALTLGEEMISASICPNQEDWYTVTAPANHKVRIEVHWSNREERYNPETRMYDGNLQPVLNVEAMNGGPMPQFGKTVLTSVRLGDLMVAGLPGEAASFIGVETYKAIKEAVKSYGTFNEVLILGYTNDHHFYIVTELDWFQGDYEPSMSIWGFKFGTFLLEHLKTMALMFASGDYSGIDEFPNTKPLKWDGLPDDTRTPLKTAKPTQDSLLYSQPSTLSLTQQFKVKWIGGDPGAEMTPKAVLEKKVDDEWKPVSYPTGEVYDENNPAHRLYTDRSYEMQLDYSNESFFLPGVSDADANNYWTYTWEERADFPVGTYRLHIYGHYYDGSADTYERDKVLEYDITSDPIEVVPPALTVQNPEFTYDICDPSKRHFSAQIRFQMPAADGDPEDFSDSGDMLTNRFTKAKTHAIVLHSTTHEPWLPSVAEDDTTVSVTVTRDGEDTPLYTRTDVPLTIGTGTAYYTNSRRSATDEDTGVIVVLEDSTEMVEAYATAGGKAIASFEFNESDADAPLPELSPGTYHVTVEAHDGKGREVSRNFKVILPEPTPEELAACQ